MTMITGIFNDMWDETTRFDYVDRIVVTFLLMFNLLAFGFILDYHLTPAEVAEIEPGLQFIGYLPVFFFLWPLIYLALVTSTKKLISMFLGQETA